MAREDHVRSINRLALQDAATSGVINAISNWFTYRSLGLVPLTVDSISSGEPTLFSRSIPGALFLCAILGTIAWFKFRKKGRALPGIDVARLDRPYFFDGLRVVAFFTIFVFGLLVTCGVLLHAFAGTLYVPPWAAVAIATAISAGAAFFITASTMRAQLRPEW
jgi:hypothetical protein